MGTRSCTYVVSKFDYAVPTVYACMYRHYDGYFGMGGQGHDLYEFLKDRRIISGYTQDDIGKRVSNGAGCLAASMVAAFKQESELGGIYLLPPPSLEGVAEDNILRTLVEHANAQGAEYTYIVRVEHGEPILVTVLDHRGIIVWRGEADNGMIAALQGADE